MEISSEQLGHGDLHNLKIINIQVIRIEFSIYLQHLEIKIFRMI